MSSIQKFFPRGEFTPVGCDDALDGAVLALKALATGRSTGLSAKECQDLYEQVWQITQCAMNDKAERDAFEATKQAVGEYAKDYVRPQKAARFETRLPIYADALKIKIKRMFGIEFSVLSAKGKKMDKVRIRTIIINATLDSEIGNLSQLGRLLKRDHATIIHGRNNLHPEFMAGDKDYKRNYLALCQWWQSVKIEQVVVEEK